MKRRNWFLLATLILLIGASLYWFKSPGEEKVSFETAILERGDLEMIISASGTLNATNTVEVGTQVSGVIDKLSVDFNDHVKKGQEIARIDTRNLQATLDQAKASVLQAEVRLEQKKRAYEFAKQYNSTGGKDLTVLEAEAAVEQVRTQMELAKLNYERNKKLFEDGVIAKIEFETKEMDYKRLKANYESVNVALNRAKANVSNVDLQKSHDDFKTAEADWYSAKANLKKARINLNYAIIRAPIAGVVISRNIEVGQTVAASFQTPVLFTIANDLTKMEIEASIDEADIGFIKVGQAVSFSVDAYLDELFSGQVEQIRLQPQIVSNVVTYTVIINANNDDLKLMPGMTANLDVITAQRKNVLKAPVAALNFTPPAEYRNPWKNYLESDGMATTISNNDWKVGVLWKVEGEHIVPRKVKTGLSDGNFTEISSTDFKEYDNVVVGMSGKGGASSNTTNPFLPSRPGAKKGEDK